MDPSALLAVGQTALELGLICSLTVLALFLSYSMLNICDLSTDGCFTLGAAVGAMVAAAGHPLLSIPAAMGAGVCSGFVTALLQTKLGIDSLLAGIIVNTETCATLGYDFEEIKAAFEPLCTKVQTITTAEEFGDLNG